MWLQLLIGLCSETEYILFATARRTAAFPYSRSQLAAYQAARDLPVKAINPIRFPLFGNIMTRSNIVDVRIMGKNYTAVDDLVKQIMEIGKDTKGVIFRYTDLHLNKPQVEVRVDPERAAHFGFDVKDIADAVESHIGGQRTSSQYDVEGRYYYVRVMGPETNFQTVDDVSGIILTSPGSPETHVPLTSVASVVTTLGPLQINHYNSKRSARVQLTVQDRPLSDVFEEVVGEDSIHGRISRWI